MDGVEVRSATTGDIPAIQQVARSAWHAAYDDVIGVTAVEETVAEWYSEETLRQSVTDDGNPFLVALDGNVVGFANAAREPESETWHLARLYVHPDRWGEGIGTLLLDHVEAALRERGVDSYELAVLAGNAVGVSFYESRGFRRTDTEIVDLAGVEVTECWYEKRL